MARELTAAKLYWDTQDPRNEGWAYNLYYDDEHEESGPWDCGRDADLQSEMVALLWHCNIEIRESDVAVEQVDGGVAHWTSEVSHTS